MLKYKKGTRARARILENCLRNNISRKRSQEEMVGFALIVIIVSVILLIFLALSLNDSGGEAVESYEVDSFIQAFLQYTTDCAEVYEPNYLTVQELIAFCDEGETCLDGADACEVLSETLGGIVEASWNVEEGSSISGYELFISSKDEEILRFSIGNVTNNYKGSGNEFSKNRKTFEVYFDVYY